MGTGPESDGRTWSGKVVAGSGGTRAVRYATGIFGKWHLGFRPEFHPQQRGFDEYFGFLGGAHDYLDAASDANNPILNGTTPIDTIGYTTEAFGREAVSFIDKHVDQPWLLYLPFNAVHAPLEATDKYLARFTSIEDPNRRTFAAMLSAMDDAVGAVLAKLRERQLEESTLVFFFSDNGGPTRQTTSGNGPLRGFKAQAWEGGIHIPFLVQWKGRIPAGKVFDHPVIQLDILPTSLAAAGVTIKPEWKLDGVNLLPHLLGERDEPPHAALYWRFGQQLAIRKGDWKLVKAPGGGAEFTERAAVATTAGAQLFNLVQDIGEQKNLAEQEPDKVKELAADWEAWNADLAPPAWEPARPAAKAAAKAKAKLLQP